MYIRLSSNAGILSKDDSTIIVSTVVHGLRCKGLCGRLFVSYLDVVVVVVRHLIKMSLQARF